MTKHADHAKHANHADKPKEAVVAEWWKSVRLLVSCTVDGNCLQSELETEASLVWPTEGMGHIIQVPVEGISIELLCLDDRVQDMSVRWQSGGHCHHAQAQLASGTEIRVDRKVMFEWGSSMEVEFAFITPPELAAGIPGAVEHDILQWPVEFVRGDAFSITAKKHERVPLQLASLKRPADEGSVMSAQRVAKCGKV